VFFFLSGYGLCISFKIKGSDYLNGFLSKRLEKLLPKFLILTLSIMLAFHFFSVLSFSEQLNNLVTKGITPLPHSWFIYVIIYAYLAFYCCAVYSKNTRQTGFMFTAAMALYVFISSRILGFASYWLVTSLTVCLGYWVALYEEKVTDYITNHKIIVFVTMILALFASFCIMCKAHILTDTWTVIWIMAQALAVYMAIRALGFSRYKFLCWVGTFSLELYLVHGIPLQACMKLGLTNYTLWILTFAMSIPFAYILKKYFHLPTRKCATQKS